MGTHFLCERVPRGPGPSGLPVARGAPCRLLGAGHSPGPLAGPEWRPFSPAPRLPLQSCSLNEPGSSLFQPLPAHLVTPRHQDRGQVGLDACPLSTRSAPQPHGQGGSAGPHLRDVLGVRGSSGSSLACVKAHLLWWHPCETPLGPGGFGLVASAVRGRSRPWGLLRGRECAPGSGAFCLKDVPSLSLGSE